MGRRDKERKDNGRKAKEKDGKEAKEAGKEAKDGKEAKERDTGRKAKDTPAGRVAKEGPRAKVDGDTCQKERAKAKGKEMMAKERVRPLATGPLRTTSPMG